MNSVKSYIIHRGNKNQKVKGRFMETINSQLGKRYLVGEELVQTLHWKDRDGKRQVDEVFIQTKIDITGCKVTTKG